MKNKNLKISSDQSFEVDEIVFVKMRGYTNWPSFITKIINDSVYFVTFIDKTFSNAKVTASNIEKFTKESYEKYSSVKKKSYIGYLNLAKDIYEGKVTLNDFINKKNEESRRKEERRRRLIHSKQKHQKGRMSRFSPSKATGKISSFSSLNNLQVNKNKSYYEYSSDEESEDLSLNESSSISSESRRFSSYSQSIEKPLKNKERDLIAEAKNKQKQKNRKLNTLNVKKYLAPKSVLKDDKIIRTENQYHGLRQEVPLKKEVAVLMNSSTRVSKKKQINEVKNEEELSAVEGRKAISKRKKVLKKASVEKKIISSTQKSKINAKINTDNIPSSQKSWNNNPQGSNQKHFKLNDTNNNLNNNNYNNYKNNKLLNNNFKNKSSKKIKRKLNARLVKKPFKSNKQPENSDISSDSELYNSESDSQAVNEVLNKMKNGDFIYPIEKSSLLEDDKSRVKGLLQIKRKRSSFDSAKNASKNSPNKLKENFPFSKKIEQRPKRKKILSKYKAASNSKAKLERIAKRSEKPTEDEETSNQNYLSTNKNRKKLIKKSLRKGNSKKKNIPVNKKPAKKNYYKLKKIQAMKNEESNKNSSQESSQPNEDKDINTDSNNKDKSSEPNQASSSENLSSSSKSQDISDNKSFKISKINRAAENNSEIKNTLKLKSKEKDNDKETDKDTKKGLQIETEKSKEKESNKKPISNCPNTNNTENIFPTSNKKLELNNENIKTVLNLEKISDKKHFSSNFESSSSSNNSINIDSLVTFSDIFSQQRRNDLIDIKEKLFEFLQKNKTIISLLVDKFIEKQAKITEEEVYKLEQQKKISDEKLILANTPINSLSRAFDNIQGHESDYCTENINEFISKINTDVIKAIDENQADRESLQLNNFITGPNENMLNFKANRSEEAQKIQIERNFINENNTNKIYDFDKEDNFLTHKNYNPAVASNSECNQAQRDFPDISLIDTKQVKEHSNIKSFTDQVFEKEYNKNNNFIESKEVNMDVDYENTNNNINININNKQAQSSTNMELEEDSKEIGPKKLTGESLVIDINFEDKNQMSSNNANPEKAGKSQQESPEKKQQVKDNNNPNLPTGADASKKEVKNKETLESQKTPLIEKLPEIKSRTDNSKCRKMNMDFANTIKQKIKNSQEICLKSQEKSFLAELDIYNTKIKKIFAKIFDKRILSDFELSLKEFELVCINFDFLNEIFSVFHNLIFYEVLNYSQTKSFVDSLIKIEEFINNLKFDEFINEVNNVYLHESSSDFLYAKGLEQYNEDFEKYTEEDYETLIDASKFKLLIVLRKINFLMKSFDKCYHIKECEINYFIFFFEYFNLACHHIFENVYLSFFDGSLLDFHIKAIEGRFFEEENISLIERIKNSEKKPLIEDHTNLKLFIDKFSTKVNNLFN